LVSLTTTQGYPCSAAFLFPWKAFICMACISLCCLILGHGICTYYLVCMVQVAGLTGFSYEVCVRQASDVTLKPLEHSGFKPRWGLCLFLQLSCPRLADTAIQINLTFPPPHHLLLHRPRTHPCTHTYTHAHKHARTRTHTYTHEHTHTSTRTRTRTRTHTHLKRETESLGDISSRGQYYISNPV